MKKVVSFILLIAMLVTFTSCGKKKEKEKEKIAIETRQTLDVTVFGLTDADIKFEGVKLVTVNSKIDEGGQLKLTLNSKYKYQMAKDWLTALKEKTASISDDKTTHIYNGPGREIITSDGFNDEKESFFIIWTYMYKGKSVMVYAMGQGKTEITFGIFYEDQAESTAESV